MKILFKYVVLVTFVFTLSACGRMGDLIPYEGYVPCFNEIAPTTRKSLEKLSDSELTLIAIDFGRYDLPEFDNEALIDAGLTNIEVLTTRNSVENFLILNEKNDAILANREELIEAFIEPELDSCPDSRGSTSSSY